MNSGGGQEGRGLVWFDRFLGRPDRPSAGGGSRPLALGSLTHASGRDILILRGEGLILSPRPSDPCRANKGISYPCFDNKERRW